MSDLAPLDPPSPSGGREVAETLPELAPERLAVLDDKALRYVRRLLAIDRHDPEFARRAGGLATLGAPEIEAATRLAARRPDTGSGGAHEAGALLDRLRALVETLDPGALSAPRRLFGLFSAAPGAGDYFDRYRRAEPDLAAILSDLARARDALLHEGARTEGERGRLRAAIAGLEEAGWSATLLDRRLSAAARELSGSDPPRAAAIRETALFQARQRRIDLLTMRAVAIQALLALDIVEANGTALVAAIDRARTVTVAALAVATGVAEALAGQRLVMERVAALDRAAAAHAGAPADRTQALARLDEAFAEVRLALDAADETRRGLAPADRDVPRL